MIDSQYFWISVFILSVGTLAIRSSIILVSHRIKITDRHRELFTFVPAAILPALVMPMVFFHKGQVDWLLNKERAFVLALAILVSLRFKNMIVSVVFGLGALYTITQVIN